MLTTLLMEAAGGGGDSTQMFIMIGAMFAVMYFFMIRPQSKKAKNQRSFWDEIKKGDPVVTSGGIHGKVVKVDEGTLLVEIDSNIKIRIEKSMISMDFTKAKQTA